MFLFSIIFSVFADNAGVNIFRDTPHGRQVLVGYGRDAYSGTMCWQSFGGKVDNGESRVNAAIRELYEETNGGIKVDKTLLNRSPSFNFGPKTTVWNVLINGNINLNTVFKEICKKPKNKNFHREMHGLGWVYVNDFSSSPQSHVRIHDIVRQNNQGKIYSSVILQNEPVRYTLYHGLRQNQALIHGLSTRNKVSILKKKKETIHHIEENKVVPAKKKAVKKPAKKKQAQLILKKKNPVPKPIIKKVIKKKIFKKKAKKAS